MTHLKSLVSNYIETNEKIKLFREVQFVANINVKSKIPSIKLWLYFH